MGHDRTSGDFGSRLRAARERRGVSLRQISAATKISLAVLEGLEHNDPTRLPGGIFSRAFVRSYAVEVGLDPDATIQEFIAEFPQQSAAPALSAASAVEEGEAFENERRMASTFLGLIAISVPIAGAVLYFGTAGRRAGVPPAPAAPPAAVSPTEGPSSSARASSGRDKDETPPVAAQAAPVAPAPAATQTDAAAAFTAAVSVTRECWVSAIVDGERTIARVMQPGESRTMDVRREMVLTAGDAAAVVLMLNGAQARPLGRDGEVVTTRLSVSNFKEFLASP